MRISLKAKLWNRAQVERHYNAKRRIRRKEEEKRRRALLKELQTVGGRPWDRKRTDLCRREETEKYMKGESQDNIKGGGMKEAYIREKQRVSPARGAGGGWLREGRCR